MAAKHSIPTKPTAVFCGVARSRQFTEGAYAIRNELREHEGIASEEGNEHRATARLAKRLHRVIAQGGEVQAGALAALAHFLTLASIECAPAAGDDWTPLASTFDGDDDSKPHPLSSFFDVAGEPVTVTPDLVARRWVDEGPSSPISIEVVRAIGKPIGRRKFDALRMRVAARS